MENTANYLEINRALWNERTTHHVDSAFYDNETFKGGKSSLKGIETSLLDDVKGKEILHLQCHFGQDTLSMARMGAKATGVDFSDEAISTARKLNEEMGLDAQFILSDVYKLPEVLDETYDVVFTTYGVLGWLPDMDKWAKVVSHFLKPGGKLVLVEFHPAVWMFDNDFTHVQYDYFNKEMIMEAEPGTYADISADMQLQSVSWNHSLGEVLGALLNAGLQIDVFNEYDYSPYECFNKIVEVGPDKYYIQGMEGKLPITYAVVASKK